MKINYIKTIGFRKFKELFETQLYDTTNISGKNRSGKSNVLYAIINIMLGTNLSGDEKAILINKNSDTSYGELHFTDNDGVKHILIRGRHKYSNKENFISLDGKIVTQNDLIKFYIDKKLFLSIVNPLYFLSKRPAEQKEMVDKYLSHIKPFDIFNALNKKLQDRLIAKYYTDEKKFEGLTPCEQENFINLHMLNIFLDIAYDNLTEEEQAILEGVPRDIPSYISETNGDIRRSESVISNLNGKIEYAQNIVNEEIPDVKSFEKDEELTLAKQELAFLNTNQDIVDKEKQRQTVEGIEKEILDRETEFSELGKTMKEGKKKYLAIKSGECSTCPTCSQHIQDESKNKTIEKMREELVSAFDKSNLLETQIRDLKLKLSLERCKYHALEGNATIKKSKRINVVEENIRTLEDERLQIEKFNSEIAIKRRTIKNAKADILKFNEDIEVQKKCIEQLNSAKKIAQKLYISYIEEKMKLAKKHLKDVDIKFYTVLKTTGEIKEDFIITYKNNPLSDLSRSETIATALEFANMFNKITNANLPVFIDDYESCADYDFVKEYSKDTQLIIAKVEKGNLLKIANANTNECTIIKPKIEGAKTINKNVADISKAA